VANYRRYLGPVGLLLAVTIAVVLIRVVFASNSSSKPPSTTTTTTTRTTAARRFWTVRAGDTLAVIASKTGVTVAAIEHLNPNISPTTLFIGEKLRLR
jgi:LysM repeat protein